jgi:Zn-dependent peptidase ImmA (M78 family)
MTADEVLSAHWDGKLPVDPVQIARRMGVSVVYFDFTDDTICEACNVNGAPTIRVRKGETAMRTKFAVAHSLGHIALHGTLPEGATP